ncbi:tRNA-dependent cyclodipeptide synthase [Saccharopolyspora sp. NPDC047091]|uniref:tRNA-dependent cyclodipeptide synthase n=1 Tax=Saccharopolyspora sp. NPDC047091 TaxID=3155924 RepID=UPI0033EF1803
MTPPRRGEETRRPNTATSTAHGFDTTPCSERCAELWRRGDHALLGVSTGNGYFTQERLLSLVNWAGHHFAEVDLMYVDTHIDSTLIAGGATPAEAARHVKSRLRDIRRKMRRVVEQHAAPCLRVRALSEFQAEPAYHRAKHRTDEALATDPVFADACADLVRRFLAGGGADVPAERIRAGMDYLLAELPFFLDAPALFGVRSSMICYHLSTPVVEYLSRPDNGVLPADREHGFLVVEPNSSS